MHIRPALKTDCAGISQLLDQLGYLGTQAFLQEKLCRLIGEPDYVNLIYVKDNVVVGFICMHIILELGLAGDTALITYLVVDEYNRGKGIGGKLEAACTDIARQRNCARMQLHCADYRKNAHLFYRSVGYVESPRYYSKEL